jgi:cytoskeletal protein CcmA (bactofilin family)
MADPIIGEGIRIEGEVSADRDLSIAGVVRGRVRVDHHLTIRAGGEVDAEVEAKRVTVLGAASGSITADRVDVKSSAMVSGDVRTPSLAIEEGARFVGSVHMELELPEGAE